MWSHGFKMATEYWVNKWWAHNICIAKLKTLVPQMVGACNQRSERATLVAWVMGPDDFNGDITPYSSSHC